MSKQIIYVRKKGSNETFAVFAGSPLLENPTVSQIDETEHKACMAEKRNAANADNAARKVGFKNAADKERADVVEKNQSSKPVKSKRVASSDSKAKGKNEEAPVVEEPVVEESE